MNEPTHTNIDIGQAAFYIQEIRKLEDAVDVLEKIKREEEIPNKKTILEIAIKIIREESDQRVMEVIQIAEEYGRLRDLPSVSEGVKEKVSVPDTQTEVIKSNDT
jgi:hypothetical protein